MVRWHLWQLDAKHARIDGSRSARISPCLMIHLTVGHLQCEGGRPCLRCIKAKRECTNSEVAKRPVFSMHLENQYASGMVKRPRGPRSSLTMVRASPNLHDCAVSYFIRHHLQPVSNMTNLAVCLPDCTAVVENARWSLTVDLAMSTLALEIYSKARCNPNAKREAQAQYCRLLRLAKDDVAALESTEPDQRRIDAILLTSMLMGRYEGARVLPTSPNTRNEETAGHNWHHHDGAVAVLQLWADTEGSKEVSTPIRMTRRSIVRTCLLRDLSPPTWLYACDAFGETGKGNHWTVS